MSQEMLSFAQSLLLMIGGVFALYSAYFCVVAMFGFKKQGAAPKAPPQTRFAVLVAARNEEAVIGQLVDSLLAQGYPRHLYDVIVAPNNCTDNTRAVAAAHGAKLFDPVGKIASKGEVLAQINKMLMAGDDYDAVCVFDADNLVHPDFLQRMNDVYAAGAQVAQGFRDSKNPADTAVSTCYSVGYWMLNRFYNGGRSALGLSALINGSGFMVGLGLLRQLGGWSTCTMTEDYEFTAQCALVGQRVHYVETAVIYDEQPLTFFQSWRQRRRWSTGSVQVMVMYLGCLGRAALRGRSSVCADLALTFMTPAVQVASLVLGLLSMLLGTYQMLAFYLMPPAVFLLGAAAMLGGAVLLCSLLAAFVVVLNRAGNLRGTGRGILYFSLFLASHVAISLVSLVKPKRSWDAMAHTRSLAIGEMVGQ